MYSVESAAMIGMRMCQKKTSDRPPKLPRRLHYRIGTAIQRRIDQGEPVVFKHQVNIYKAVIRELDEMVSVLLYSHVANLFVSFRLVI